MTTPLIPFTETLKRFSFAVLESLKTSVSDSFAAAPTATAGLDARPVPSVAIASVLDAPTPIRLLSLAK